MRPFAPQVACGEPDGVDGFDTRRGYAPCPVVRQRALLVNMIDAAYLPARVGGHPGVVCGVDRTDAHQVTRLKSVRSAHHTISHRTRGPSPSVVSPAPP